MVSTSEQSRSMMDIHFSIETQLRIIEDPLMSVNDKVNAASRIEVLGKKLRLMLKPDVEPSHKQEVSDDHEEIPNDNEAEMDATSDAGSDLTGSQCRNNIGIDPSSGASKWLDLPIELQSTLKRDERKAINIFTDRFNEDEERGIVYANGNMDFIGIAEGPRGNIILQYDGFKEARPSLLFEKALIYHVKDSDKCQDLWVVAIPKQAIFSFTKLASIGTGKIIRHDGGLEGGLENSDGDYILAPVECLTTGGYKKSKILTTLVSGHSSHMSGTIDVEPNRISNQKDLQIFFKDLSTKKCSAYWGCVRLEPQLILGTRLQFRLVDIPRAAQLLKNAGSDKWPRHLHSFRFVKSD